MPDSVQPYGIVACQAPLPTGFSKARIMGWVNIPSSREFTQPIDQARGISCIFCIAGRFFYSWATQEAPILKLTYPLILLKASFLFPSWILSVPILLKKKKKTFKVLIEFVRILLLFYILGVYFCFPPPPDIWNLSSLTRDWTYNPLIGRWNLNHWTAQEVSGFFFLLYCLAITFPFLVISPFFRLYFSSF